jgi:hypothetical protein
MTTNRPEKEPFTTVTSRYSYGREEYYEGETGHRSGAKSSSTLVCLFVLYASGFIVS